jgi:putative transposase
MLTLIDEYTRQCLAIRPARKLTSEDVLEVVKEAVREHSAPDHLRSDNGSGSSPGSCRTGSGNMTSRRSI